MFLPRVIPCLLIESQRLVKTIRFEKPNYVGDPINAVKIFNELEVDEIIILDIAASKKGRELDFVHIQEIVSEAFMPVAVGGGIRTIDAAAKLVNLGVEKVVVNTAALDDLKIVEQIASRFGSSSTVVAVDVKKNLFGGYRIYDHRSKKTASVDYLKYIKNAADAGAGEIFLNFVDNDGTGNGYNYNLITQISSEINLPLVVCGGAGSLDDMYKAVKAGAAAAAAGSMFVYKGRHRAVMINYPEYETIKKLFYE